MVKATYDIYSNVLDKEFTRLLSDWLDEFVRHFGASMFFGSADMSAAVRRLLEIRLEEERCRYVESRSAGESRERAFERVERLLWLFSSHEGAAYDHRVSVSNTPWEEALGVYAGCVLVYADYAESIMADREFLICINATALLLTTDEFPDGAEFPEGFTALRMPHTGLAHSDSPYLRRCFPYVHKIANSMSWLLDILRPSRVIIYGNHSIEGIVLERIAARSGASVTFR